MLMTGDMVALAALADAQRRKRRWSGVPTHSEIKAREREAEDSAAQKWATGSRQQRRARLRKGE